MWIDSRGSTVLPAPECMRLLAVAAQDIGVGRIGLATDQAPIVVPVNFTVYGNQVLLRLGIGFISHAAIDHLVAFEVDHVDRRTNSAWSVLVRGLATLIDDQDEASIAAAPKPLVAEPGDMVLAIRTDVVSGRRFDTHPAR